MNKDLSIKYDKGDVLEGSRKISFDNNDKRLNREEYMIKYINFNKALKFYERKYGHEKSISIIKNDYLKYRKLWKEQPAESISNAKALLEVPPLCVDIEAASICDLACPFCYRSFIATPDKVMDYDFAISLINQISDLKVPSMKFNWRGEPLLHPKLEDLIAYAKSNGIIETLINTNATRLNEKRAEKIIESGLDHMIYSFDGGSKESYEKNRPGRFSDNSFEKVYENIKRFKKIRDSIGSKFPRTKIQMILTEDTYKEQENFLNLFWDYVDEVTVTQYSERGGGLSDLTTSDKNKVVNKARNLGYQKFEDLNYMKTGSGEFFISKGRKPCEQPFQRLLITYDGRVSMCCYDWGAKHTIACLKDLPRDPNYDKDEPMEKSKNSSRSFKNLQSIELPKQYVKFPNKAMSLKQAWNSKTIQTVRRLHTCGKVDALDICSNCSFKDTYDWE